VGVNGHIDLFSGIGGFSLAAERTGFSTKVFCEKDPYCRTILKKHWPSVPIVEDIRDFRGDSYGKIEILTGGFPCQPFSQAGKQRGKEDDRYLWPEMLRVIQEAKPSWIVGENVFGIINLALDQVHSDLEAVGYEVETLVIPAAGVDAPHRRDRCWIIARILGDTKYDGLLADKISGGLQYEPEEQEKQDEIGQPSGASGIPEDVAYSNGGQLGQCESQSESVSVSGAGGQRVCDDVAYTFGNSERSAHGFDCGKCGQERKEQDIGEGSQVGSHAGNSREDVADTESVQSRQSSQRKGREDSGGGGEDCRRVEGQGRETLADTIRQGRKGRLQRREDSGREAVHGHARCGGSGIGQHGWSVWLPESGICRVANGIPYRVDRLKSLGNAIVPQVAEAIFKKIRAVNQALTK
jgi:DNA (cytosine-5)-methyltransferase 1